MQNLGLKNPILEKFRSKIENLSTVSRNLLFCIEKMQLPALSTFFTQDALQLVHYCPVLSKV